jgi:hypothetical protein
VLEHLENVLEVTQLQEMLAEHLLPSVPSLGRRL